MSTEHRPYLAAGDAAEQPLPATAALATLIPGGNPQRMSVVVTETTPGGAHHTWSGSLATLAARIAPAPAPALSDGERSFLAFALDLASDHMARRGDEFGDDDWATLATLRKLAEAEPPADTDPWAVVARLAAWLDDCNGSSTPETALRLMKVQEEAGEVAAAWIGVVGQNPRKGVTHTTGEVLGELCDVIVAAMVAMATLTEDPAARFAAKLAEIAGLRLDAAGGES